MGQMLARFSLPTLSASTWRSRFSLWQPSLTVVTEDDARTLVIARRLQLESMLFSYAPAQVVQIIDPSTSSYASARVVRPFHSPSSPLSDRED